MSVDPLCAPFVDGLAHRRLRYQACTACGAAQTLARYACARCGGRDLRWRDATGGGTVYATTVVARAPTQEFRALVPYTLVIVELDEGPRLMAHARAGVRIGDRVQATYLRVAGHTLVRFVPVTSGAS